MPTAAPVPPVGRRLRRSRLARGWSQVRLAERLCATAGVPTVTRHEVSRWERGERVPGPFWLGWLAAVLATPVGDLAGTDPAPAGAPPWPPAATSGGPDTGTADPPTATCAGPGRIGTADLAGLAHAWLAGSTRPPAGGRDEVRRLATQLGAIADRLADSRDDPPGPAGSRAPRCATPAGQLDLAAWRRLHDLVGGLDLAGPAGRAVAHAARRIGRTAPAGAAPLAWIGQAADLLAAVAADAGDRATALTAYHLGLLAASAAGDRPLAGHLLGAASDLLLTAADPDGALLLARTAQLGAGRASSATGRAVLLHRVALAAAHGGRRGLAQRALAAAATATARRTPAADPPWLAGLDGPALRVLTGRCLRALGQPVRARPLLRAAPAGGPRAAALTAAWLAECHLDLGDVDRAAQAARSAVLDAVRAGSTRAAAEARLVTARLAAHQAGRHRSLPATGYLPDAGPAGDRRRVAS